MKKSTLTLLFILACCQSLLAQPYYFRHYQVEQGLSHNTVFCTAQDKKGFLWLGTKDGLNRFDGYTFNIFRNNPDETRSLGDNFIRSLLIDSSDFLYAGTRNGIYRYNSLRNDFDYIVRTREEVRDMKKDRHGRLWFIEGQTLFNFDERSKKIERFPQSKFFPATSIAIDSNGILWVSTADGYLQQYTESTKTFRSFNVFSSPTESAPRWIEKIYVTANQSILVATSNYGVKEFNLADYHSKDILTYNADRTEIFARHFVQTSAHEFWIATESGIFIYNSATGNFTNLQKQYNNPYSVSDNAVYCLFQDKEGGIWAGTYFGGINYYPKQYNSFEKFFPGYTSTSLSGNAVREITADKLGNLWIGTEDAGLNMLDKRTGLFKQFKPTGSGSDISYPNIHGLLANDNELWIGTFEHGLDIMDIRTGRVKKHYPVDSNSKALKSNFIVVIRQTKNGTILIGTREGLYRYDAINKDFETIPGLIVDGFVHSITEDKNGTIWVGSLGNGLYYFNPGRKRQGRFTMMAGKKSLGSNSITTVFESARGDLWIGTEGAGLYRFNESDSTFAEYGGKHGFPSNTIFSILEDSRNQLWITTSRGLVAFHPATERLNIYTTANGLLSNQFNYNSGYKDSLGRMYFGSAKGLIRFNPDSFLKNSFVPPVFITSLYLNNQELAEDQIRSMASDGEIEIKHDRSSFSIDFAALTFTAPEMTKYSYIMDGLDKDWTYLKTNRKVYFTDLAPGSYTFKVKAATTSGVWTNQIAQLKISVLPPFWASPLAYALYLVLALVIIYFLFRIYHNNLLEKTRQQIEHLEHEKEKEIYQAKIDFFTNIAHEIKTPLTLIKAPMENIIRKAGNLDIDRNLRIMEKNTDRLIELTNQLLDFRRIETKGFTLTFAKTNISELLLDRYLSFKPLAEQKNITLSINLPENVVIAHVDTDSLQKILNNLLYNAVLYSQTFVSVSLSLTDSVRNGFSIEVSNDGFHIPAEMSEKIFEPFYRLKETQSKSGSGIGLALSKSLVDLHKGELYLKTGDQAMNTFVLVLPLHQYEMNGQE
ncbi:MAG: histidine kinase [Chitinophagaceae bacterium]|nr:histidine kinase [Chitinophagaceae bacterium]